MPPAPHCRYISSYDGYSRCTHGVHAQGFCRFHYQACAAGDITAEGYLADTLSDQVRRREINFHGIAPAAVYVGPGSGPVAADCTPQPRATTGRSARTT
jgi:hypothetical protein